MNRTRPIAFGAAIVCTAVAAAALGPGVADYDVSWHTIDGGGEMWSTGGDYELSGTIGQPDGSLAG